MNNNVKIVPFVSYIASKDKSLIYKDNVNKSGIYRWNNTITNKSYVGSSKNLGSRLSVYYSRKSMLAKVKTRTSIIYSALLKHGHDNFSLDILEYCEIDLLVEREQYYLDLLKPNYNILMAANSRLGSKHSLETKALISLKLRGINNPAFGKVLSSETRMRISESLKSSILFKNAMESKSKFIANETKLKMSLRSRGVKVKVFDINNNLIKEFPTMISVALHFTVSSRTIGRYLDKNIPYNGFIFKSNLLE